MSLGNSFERGSYLSVYGAPEHQEEHIIDFGRFESLQPQEESLVRLDEEEKIHQTLSSGVPVLLRGRTRSGNSTFLESLSHHYYPNAYTVSGSELGEQASAVSGNDEEWSSKKIEIMRTTLFYRAFRKYVSARNDSDDLTDKFMQSPDPLKFFNEVLERDGQEVLLTIEEALLASSFSQNPDEVAKSFELMADMGKESHIHLTVQMHWSSSEQDALSTAFSGFSEYFLRPLSEGEIKVIIEDLLSNTGIHVDDEVYSAMYHYSGGRPVEAKLAAKVMLVHGLSMRPKEGLFTMREWSEVEALPPRQMLGSSYQSILGSIQHDVGSLSVHEQNTLKTIIAGGEIFEGDLPMVNTLSKLGFIEEYELGYRIKGIIQQQLLGEVFANFKWAGEVKAGTL